MESSVVLDCIYLRCMTQIQFTAELLQNWSVVRVNFIFFFLVNLLYNLLYRNSWQKNC